VPKVRSSRSSPFGIHRVSQPVGVLPQAAQHLDASPELWEDEVRLRVEALNLDSSSYRQLVEEAAGDFELVRTTVVGIIAQRGKMHNPVTGSGGMLVGIVDEVGVGSPLGLRPGERVATLVSLTVTPLAISDSLTGWDGRSQHVPTEGHAILFSRSATVEMPPDVPTSVALDLFDVAGAPALTARVVGNVGRISGRAPRVAVLGASGKSGSLALVAAQRAGAAETLGVVPSGEEAAALTDAAIATQVVVADATDAMSLVENLATTFDVTVVCTNVPGTEEGAILATSPGGTVVFFSMATVFSRAALSAEGVLADITLLIGNGYVPGAAGVTLQLWRETPGLQRLFRRRLHPYG
jgi:L-erythro-3,5-diaminohexanoate dehydrogenase